MTDWRLAAAGEALARHLESAPLEGRILVLRDPDPTAARALEKGGGRVVSWDRFLRPDAVVSSWPPDGPFDAAALRLPRSKEELEMWIHAATARVRSGGALLVYGANDEGIRSAAARMEPLLGPVSTVEKKSHCRVLRVERSARVSGLRGEAEDWRSTWTLEVDGRKRPWVSWPGVFAHGQLDGGTALLLETLPTPPPGSRILDYGCGSGVVAGVLLDREPSLEAEMLDPDALALEAARRNVPDARAILADALPGAGTTPYDWIVSNPPYHRSKAQTLEVVRRLIREAPARLVEEGRLALVVQRRLPVEEELQASFRSVERLAADATYRVWLAGGPRRS